MQNNSYNDLDADNYAKAFKGVKGLENLDNGLIEKLEKLERQALYRSYYFPGGTAKHFISGIGTDTDSVHYDGITSERDLFSDWNPRYLDDYIEQAKQYGFHRHFLYYNGQKVQHISFDEAIVQLNIVSKNIQPEIYYGILTGLEYMDKFNVFFTETAGQIQLTKGQAKLSLKNCSDVAENIIEKANAEIKALIGVSSKDFIENDSGWLTSDYTYSFMGDIYNDWISAQEEYKKYKEKIWNIISKMDNINICSNYIGGIQVGNVTITQIANCIQKINTETGQDSKTNTEQSWESTITFDDNNVKSDFEVEGPLKIEKILKSYNDAEHINKGIIYLAKGSNLYYYVDINHKAVNSTGTQKLDIENWNISCVDAQNVAYNFNDILSTGGSTLTVTSIGTSYSINVTTGTQYYVGSFASNPKVNCLVSFTDLGSNTYKYEVYDSYLNKYSNISVSQDAIMNHQKAINKSSTNLDYIIYIVIVIILILILVAIHILNKNKSKESKQYVNQNLKYIQ